MASTMIAYPSSLSQQQQQAFSFCENNNSILEDHLTEIADCEPLLDYLHSNGAISDSTLCQISSLPKGRAQMRLLLDIIIQGHSQDESESNCQISANAHGLLVNVLRVHGYFALASILDNERRIQTPLEKSSIHSLAGYEFRTRRRRGQIGIILQVSAVRVSACAFGLQDSMDIKMMTTTCNDSALLLVTPEKEDKKRSSFDCDEIGRPNNKDIPTMIMDNNNATNATIWIQNPAISPNKLFQSMLSQSSILLTSNTKDSFVQNGDARRREEGDGDGGGARKDDSYSNNRGGCFSNLFCCLFGIKKQKRKEKLHEKKEENQEFYPTNNFASPNLSRKSHSENEISKMSHKLLSGGNADGNGGGDGGAMDNNHNDNDGGGGDDGADDVNRISSSFLHNNFQCFTPIQQIHAINHSTPMFNQWRNGDFKTPTPKFSAIVEENNSHSLEISRQKKAEILSDISRRVYALLQPIDMEELAAVPPLAPPPPPTITQPISTTLSSSSCRDVLSRFIQQDCGVLLMETVCDIDAFILVVCCTKLIGLENLHSKVMDGSMAKQLEKRLFTEEIKKHYFHGVNDIRLSMDLNPKEYKKAQSELAK